ncbi:hypothetical protein GOB91_29175 [Sinorhizobium meliloti]|nr:hypothetical protein [Sinorhizobium meliloti]MDW9732627.1 hypothetical protein [Sinorhizobium meliloti]
MSIHVTTSFEAALNRHYAAVATRLRGQPKRVMLRVAAPPPPPAETSRFKQTTRDEQNEFIKIRCQQLRVQYKDITAERLTHRAAALRNQILLEVKDRWPHANARRLGDLFNRRANSIRDLFASFKGKSPERPITPEAVETMRQMRAEGVNYSKIAEAIGVTPNTVRYHLGKAE